MEFDELLVTTGVDALVRLVREKQKIELELASKILKIDMDQIEEWARVLDEEGIIRIDYYLTKVYLSWVSVTQEEAKKEETTIYRTKDEISSKASQLKSKIEPEVQSIKEMEESFDEFYKKIHPRMEKIESALEKIPDINDIINQVYGKHKEKAEDISRKLSEIQNSHSTIKTEVEKIKNEILNRKEKDLEEIGKLRGDIEGIKEDLSKVEKKIDETKKIMPQDVQKLDISKKVEKIKSEFTEMARSNSKIREDMRNLTEISQISESITDAIKKHEDKTEKLRIQMREMAKTIEEVQKRSTEVLSEIKSDTEIVERFADSIDVAKEIMEKFPSQKNITKQIEMITENEKKLESKIDSMQKFLAEMEGPIDIIKEFKKVQKKAEDIRNQIVAESDEIFKAVEEEGSTYVTFQKIKEKAVASLEGYTTQLSEVEKRIESIKKDLEDATKLDIKDYKEKISKDELGELTMFLEEIGDIKKKKELIEEVREKIETVSDSADSLNKRLNLLAKQASMLSIRTGEKREAVEEEVKNQINLSRDEELEFAKKREELKNLIKKLWEEE